MSDQPIPDPTAMKQTFMRVIEAWRRHISRCCHPKLGYGPPLTRGEALWACAAHRAEVEALIRRTA